MHRGVNSHWYFVGIFARDLFVNFEQIAVSFPNRIFAQALDCIREIEIDTAPAGADTAAFVANFLGRA